jgi:hypothetical protein
VAEVMKHDSLQKSATAVPEFGANLPFECGVVERLT